MALNFTEKQHWKTRIEAKIGQRIAKLRADHAELIDELTDQAKDEVMQSLKLAEDFETLNRLDDELVALEEKKDELLRSMQKKVSGDDPSGDRWSFRRLHGVLSDREEDRAEELLRLHPLGLQIEALQTEKEKLGDAVLLAASVQQIVDLWDRVTLLVSGQAAEPEQEMLFRECEDDPADDDGA